MVSVLIPGPGSSLTHAHTDGGARESRAQNREEKKEPNQCWTSAYDRWQSRVLLLFSPFLSNSLSFPFCFSLSVSRPLRVLSPTIAWASANTSRAHLFGNEKPVAQPMRLLQELKGRRKKRERRGWWGEGCSGERKRERRGEEVRELASLSDAAQFCQIDKFHYDMEVKFRGVSRLLHQSPSSQPPSLTMAAIRHPNRSPSSSLLA